MEKIILNKNTDIEHSFFYAYSCHARNVDKFRLQEDHIANYTVGGTDTYTYASIVTKKKYGKGCRISTKCSFGKFGAPLIVFAGELKDGKNNMKCYDLHFEVVAYEGGYNIWRVLPAHNDSSLLDATRIAFAEFEILPNELIDIEVAFGKKRIEVSINGRTAIVEHEDFPEKFHVGITGCEGPNKFYEVILDERNQEI